MALSSTAGRRHYGRSYLSDDFHAALRRRLRELGGLALFAAVGVAVFALATWSINDPSLSYATSAPVRRGTAGGSLLKRPRRKAASTSAVNSVMLNGLVT